MRPQPFFFMPGSAARTVWNDDERLIARIASHLSGGKSSIGATCWMPALLTRTSTPPSSVVARFIIATIVSGFVMSAGSNSTLTRCSEARRERSRSISAASPKPFRMRFAPSCASRVAMPRPMPEVDPVTSAVLPAKEGGFMSFL